MPIFSQFGEIVWQRLFDIARILQTTALKYFNRIRNRVPNLGTDSREKGIHFIGTRELNIKRVARDRSCSLVMNLTCFNELIENTNWCCLSVAFALFLLSNINRFFQYIP